MPHKIISPLRCDPPGETSQDAPHDIALGIQHYFQIFPDFIQLNSAETPVLLFTQKNISNQYQIRNNTRLLQKLSESVFHHPAPARIFPDFLEFFLHVLHFYLLQFLSRKCFYPNSKLTSFVTPKFAFFPMLQLRFDCTIGLISLFPSYKLSTIRIVSKNVRNTCLFGK